MKYAVRIENKTTGKTHYFRTQAQAARFLGKNNKFLSIYRGENGDKWQYGNWEIEHLLEKQHTRKPIKVRVTDTKTNEVNIFDSQTQASLFIGAGKTYIGATSSYKNQDVITKDNYLIEILRDEESSLSEKINEEDEVEVGTIVEFKSNEMDWTQPILRQGLLLQIEDYHEDTDIYVAKYLVPTGEVYIAKEDFEILKNDKEKE